MSTQENKSNSTRVALVTGAAKRLGAALARQLHQHGFNVVVHYNASKKEAQALCDELNQQRPSSALTLQADLRNSSEIAPLIMQAANAWNRLDGVINNASNFFPTPLGTATEEQWEDLFASNLKAPFFLAQAAAPHLAKHRGWIINIADIHGQKPLRDYPIYSVAKAGLIMLTHALAKELAPKIRVNAIAPGPIVWQGKETELSPDLQAKLIKRTPLQRLGHAEDIAKTALYLIEQADYVTGQVINVAGGRG